MNYDSAIEKAMRSYARAAALDLARNGISWDSIPKRRLDAREAPEGWIVSCYLGVFSMREDVPHMSWLVRANTCRQVSSPGRRRSFARAEGARRLAGGGA